MKGKWHDIGWKFWWSGIMECKWYDVGWEFCMNKNCPHYASRCNFTGNQWTCNFFEEKENEQ